MGSAFRPFAAWEDLADRGPSSFEDDREGNLWIATSLSGAVRVARHGFVTYGRERWARRAPVDVRR